MKNLTKLTVCTAVLASTLMAQRPFGVLTSGSAPDPATAAANQVARLTTLLSLTTAQQAQATTIFTNSLTAITPLRASEVTAQQALPAAVKSGANSTIDSLASTIGSLSGQIISIQNKADAAFYAILTSDQQTTLSQTNFLNGPGPGGFGPGPGPGGHGH
jgi:Spy/CpxP family protein refolding chaperone